jgi:hypothetical protein
VAHGEFIRAAAEVCFQGCMTPVAKVATSGCSAGSQEQLYITWHDMRCHRSDSHGLPRCAILLRIAVTLSATPLLCAAGSKQCLTEVFTQQPELTCQALEAAVRGQYSQVSVADHAAFTAAALGAISSLHKQDTAATDKQVCQAGSLALSCPKALGAYSRDAEHSAAARRTAAAAAVAGKELWRIAGGGCKPGPETAAGSSSSSSSSNDGSRHAATLPSHDISRLLLVLVARSLVATGQLPTPPDTAAAAAAAAAAVPSSAAGSSTIVQQPTTGFSMAGSPAAAAAAADMTASQPCSLAVQGADLCRSCNVAVSWLG